MELADLLGEFESLGDNCEFGVIHRAAGAKGKGLFQWAGMPIANLIPALHNGFAGFDDPSNYKIAFHGQEYMVYMGRFAFRMHTGSYKTHQTEEKVVKEASGRIRFLVRKLIQDFEEGSKIFVFRQNEELDLPTMLELRNAVASYGSNTILWVKEEPERPEGTITWLEDGLMTGSIGRLSVRTAVAATSFQGWHNVLWNAYAACSFGGDPTYLAKSQAIHRLGARVADVGFTLGRPDSVSLASGWCATEARHTWSGADSQLVLQNGAPQADLLLRVDGFPFVDGLGRGPRMIISANGRQVKKYASIPKCGFQCVVPRSCIKADAPLELRFQFPDAGTPASIGAGQDYRTLGYAFRSLTLDALL